MAASSAGLLTSIIIDIVVCIIAFLAFSIFRILPCSRNYFAPKSYTPGLPNKPKDLPTSFLGWLWPIITYKEPEIITSAGLDTAMYLRVLSFGVELFGFMTVFCLAVILPVNLTASYIDDLQSSSNSSDSSFQFSEFDKCGLSNVEESSPRMWAHLACVYVVTLLTLWLLYKYSKESVLLRIMFLANSPKGRSSHTVLVTDIPEVTNYTSKRLRGISEQRKTQSQKMLLDPAGSRSAKSMESAASASMPQQAAPAGAVGGTNKQLIKELSDEVNRLKLLAEQKQDLKQTSSGDDQPAAGRSKLSGAGAATGAGAADPSAPGPAQLSGSAGAAGLPGSYDGDSLSADGSSRPPTAAIQAAAEAASAAAEPSGPEGKGTSAGREVVDASSAGAGGVAPPPAPAPVPVPQPKDACQMITYDLHDESLNPHVMAAKLIGSGLSPKGLVEKEFNDVYPGGAVTAVQMNCDQSKLDPLVAEYNKLKLQLEDLLDEEKFRFDKGLEVKRSKTFIIPMTMGKWGKEHCGRALIKRVDALEFYISRLRELDFLIEQEQPLSADTIWPSAFVTFRSRQDQACATTGLHHHDTAVWLVHPAAEPDELLWSNLGMTLPTRSTRNMLMWVAFWAMCFFFMIPVGFVQALIEGPQLSSNPVLGPFVSDPVVSKLLEGIIPGLALKIFLILVPMILTMMIKASGATSLSVVDLGVVSRYFVFQVIVVFFGSVIMGSFFNQVEQWIQDPGSVISVLGTAIPMVSTFFITYIAVNGLMVKPLAFIRITGLAIYWLLAKFSGSPKARDRLWQQQTTTLGTTVVDHTITMLLGLVYCCINPVITPFCLTYFAVNLVIERYQNIYVTTREYESAGQLWPKVFTQALVCLYLMQLTMLGLLGIKKFVYAPLLIPALFITLAFHIMCLGIFDKPWRLMSLHDAAELDRREHEAEEEQKLIAAAQGGAAAAVAAGALDVYLSPVFKVVPGAIEDLLDEASEMAKRIDATVGAKAAEEPTQAGNV